MRYQVMGIVAESEVLGTLTSPPKCRMTIRYFVRSSVRRMPSLARRLSGRGVPDLPSRPDPPLTEDSGHAARFSVQTVGRFH
jgi:hypothetical protein